MPYYDKKEYVTQKEIEKDVRAALKEFAPNSKASYKRGVVLGIVAGILLGCVVEIHPRLGVYVLLLILFAVLVSIPVSFFVLRRRQKRFCIDDYRVAKATVVDRSEEHYVARSRHRSRIVYLCHVEFDNGEIWLIPKDNFAWSEQARSAPFLYSIAEPGKTFWIVQRKDTGKIVVAYPTELFTYREEPGRISKG